MAKELHYKRNNAVYSRMLGISILGVVLVSYYYIQDLSTASLVYLIFLSSIGFMFLAILGTSLVKLIKNSAALTLNENGLVDRISLAKVGEIPWRSIKFAKYEKYLNQDQILIGISDSEKYIESLPYLKKKLVNQQYVDTGAIIVVNPKMIKGNPEEIISKIKRRARV